MAKKAVKTVEPKKTVKKAAKVAKTTVAGWEILTADEKANLLREQLTVLLKQTQTDAVAHGVGDDDIWVNMSKSCLEALA